MKITYQRQEPEHTGDNADSDEGHLSRVVLDHTGMDDRTVGTISHRGYRWGIEERSVRPYAPRSLFVQADKQRPNRGRVVGERNVEKMLEMP